MHSLFVNNQCRPCLVECPPNFCLLAHRTPVVRAGRLCDAYDEKWHTSEDQYGWFPVDRVPQRAVRLPLDRDIQKRKLAILICFHREPDVCMGAVRCLGDLPDFILP